MNNPGYFRWLDIMSKIKKAFKNVFKMGLAIAAVLYPAVSLVEPFTAIISEIIESNQPLSKYESKMRKKLKCDLNECVKKTLESIKNNATADTMRTAAFFLQPYLKARVSNKDIYDLTEKEIEETIMIESIDDNVFFEMNVYGNDIKLLNETFFKSFNIIILSFPELSDYYNQCNNSYNKDNIDKLWNELSKIKKEFSEVITPEKLIGILKKSFEDERRRNPSLDNLLFSEELLPKGNMIEQSITSTINKDRTHIPISSFLNEMWNTTAQNHITITGIGGIGKTVALFNLKYPVPAIYIPLRDLPVSPNDLSHEYISEYIKETTLYSIFGAFDILLQICNKPWNNSPSIILLLDGLNEVSTTKAESIVREVRTKWAKKQGIQIIITSRYDINNKLRLKNLNQVSIDPLSEKTIINYLKDANVAIPDKSNKLRKIIDTPLMLMLYTRSELVRVSHNSDYANWRKVKNGGSIIWNYLQSELCKADIHTSLESIISIHFFAPFICYKMVLNNLFSISTTEFKEYISEASSYYNKLMLNNSLPSVIVKAIDESEETQIEELHFYNLLTKNYGLFRLRCETIQLVHQHFRDCFAAIHIIQVAENSSTMPDEWKNDFDPYVTEFICDLLLTENNKNGEASIWEKIWSFEYQKDSENYKFTSKMLNIYKKAYGNNISKINFCGVDLRNISLSTFKLTEESKMHFIDTKIGHNTFFGNGHSDTVTSTSWSVDDKYYISASHDHTIRIHDPDHQLIGVLDGPHKHYTRCALCSPINENVIASAGDDGQIICWTREKTSMDPDETNTIWTPKIIGQCSDWIRSLQWDKKGLRIICGDGSGRIKLFDDGKTINFDHKHKKNVRHLKWLECDNISVIASGADDGLFCIWSESGNCLFEEQLNSPITSINWLQNGSYLIVSTSTVIYYYKINYLIQDDNYSVNLTFIKDFKGEDISCIASASVNSLDYLAIFDNNNLSIFNTFNVNDELQIDEIGNYPYSETNKIIAATWNKTCKKIICGSRDGTVCCIEIDRNEETNRRIIFEMVGQRCCKAARCSSWSPNGKWLAVGYDDHAIRIWDPFTVRCLAVLKKHSDSIKCLNWAPDSSSIVSGSDDNSIIIWSGKTITQLKPKTIFKNKEPINTVIWLKNNTIISGGDDGSLVFMRGDGFKNIIIKKEHSQRVYSLTAYGNYVISGGNDDYIILWNLKNNYFHKYNSGHLLPIRTVCWSNNGKAIISSSNDGTIKSRSFDFNNKSIKKTIKTFPKMHNDFIYGASISNNNLYVIGGSSDSTVGFWKLSNMKFIYKSNAHKGFVWNVSSSPNINNKFYISTSSSDGTVKIWDLSDNNLNSIEPCFSLPVIPEVCIVGCDFSGAEIEDKDLKNLIIANGGILTNESFCQV